MDHRSKNDFTHKSKFLPSQDIDILSEKVRQKKKSYFKKEIKEIEASPSDSFKDIKMALKLECHRLANFLVQESKRKGFVR